MRENKLHKSQTMSLNAEAAGVVAASSSARQNIEWYMAAIKNFGTEGAKRGQTDFFMAVVEGAEDFLNENQTLPHKKLPWDQAITTPMKMGDHSAETPFFAAANTGRANYLKAMIWRLGAKKAWGLINMPVKSGTYLGETPLFAAVKNGHGEIVAMMQSVASEKEWNAAIKFTITRGKYAGESAYSKAIDKKEKKATPGTVSPDQAKEEAKKERFSAAVLPEADTPKKEGSGLEFIKYKVVPETADNTKAGGTGDAKATNRIKSSTGRVSENRFSSFFKKLTKAKSEPVAAVGAGVGAGAGAISAPASGAS